MFWTRKQIRDLNFQFKAVPKQVCRTVTDQRAPCNKVYKAGRYAFLPEHGAGTACPARLTVFTMMVLYSASGAIFLDWMVSIQGTHLPRSLSNTKSYT